MRPAPAHARSVGGEARPLRIGEAARHIGVSPSALRQWERQGLVHPSRSRGRYRLYSVEDLERLQQIRRMREVDRVNAPGIRRLLAPPSASSGREQAVDGSWLRQLRRACRLSLREAGERSGLSVSFISAVERGASDASVAALQRMVSAYGTTLVELLDRQPRARRLIRASERPVLTLAHEGVRIEQLAEGATHLEPQLFSLLPGASSEGSYTHAGEEFLYVLEGSLTIWIGDGTEHRLQPGDALTFPSTLPHRWRSTTRAETRLLWINTPPTF